MQKIKPLFKYLRNFYLVTGILALLWMTFFDRYNFISQYKTHQRISELEADLKFYKDGYTEIQEWNHLLENDPAELERLAREEHFMKRPDEDVYVIKEK